MLRDDRLEKLADVLVNYSTAVRPGDLVRLRGSSVCEPLLLALYRTVLKAGAHPVIRMNPDECEELMLKYGSPQQLQFLNPMATLEIGSIDVSIALLGSSNTKSMSRVAPERQALVSRAQRPIVDVFLKRSAEKSLRWMVTEYPTHAAAQDAEMSLQDYQDFVFRAGKLYCDDPATAWRDVQDCQQRVCDHLERARELRFVTPQGTDLRLMIEGRRWINCCGRRNFPDGEVYTGPIETETQGQICFSFPAVHGGRECDGIRLEFRDGRVVDASAKKGEAFLLEMLDQDDGARCLGEIGIGTNYSITQYSRNVLFDEKIGGTFHAAVGSSYPESGGKNESALHWDLVCDLRDGGRIEVDGQLVSENGRFLDPGWPQPE
jgi:aminopeptidase